VFIEFIWICTYLEITQIETFIQKLRPNNVFATKVRPAIFVFWLHSFSRVSYFVVEKSTKAILRINAEISETVRVNKLELSKQIIGVLRQRKFISMKINAQPGAHRFEDSVKV